MALESVPHSVAAPHSPTDSVLAVAVALFDVAAAAVVVECDHGSNCNESAVLSVVHRLHSDFVPISAEVLPSEKSPSSPPPSSLLLSLLMMRSLSLKEQHSTDRTASD